MDKDELYDIVFENEAETKSQENETATFVRPDDLKRRKLISK